jgi:hypothetical protein
MTKLKRLKSAKGKRWAKGQSSSSNPDLKIHRDAAKRGFGLSNQVKQKGRLDFLLV